MTDRTPIVMLDPSTGTAGQVPTINPAGTAVEYAAAAGGASDLDGLSDVDTTTTPPADGEGLLYDDASGLWVPSAVVMAGEYESTGVALAASVARDTTSAATYAEQEWTVTFGVPVELTAFKMDFFQADTYTLSVDGVVVDTKVVAALATGVTFTPASPLYLDPIGHSFKIAGTAARRFYHRDGANGSTRTGSGAAHVTGWGQWRSGGAVVGTGHYVAATVEFTPYALMPVPFATHVHAAADVTYAGSTDLAATNVEAALDELDAEKAAVGHTHSGGGTGSGEALMQDGVAAPPVPIETEAQTDWLYEG